MKEKVTFAPYDPADYIGTLEDVLAFLNVAMEENDAEFLLSAMGDVMRSKGMAQLAQNVNMDKRGLYKAFSSEGNPSFITVVKVLDNLGIRLKMESKSA
ncbi:MAG: putative addiction module antidote protein [Spirochaetaceae bacterium]|jgi:probable addiction module antidote protein|nr:putative addiction module antidote protein [Spirochaetaceae bacterium]